jgi:large subunit ribosomal protein L10
MPRPEKVKAVSDIKERIERAQAVFLAEFAGLSVKAQQRLRRDLRAQGAEFKVVKMTLARRAATELELGVLDDLLVGPTGVTYADGDPVGTAKVLRDFAKDHDVFSVKGGLLGGDFLTPERIAALADIEPRDVLLARMAGAIKAPMAKAAGLFAALPRNTAYALKQLLDKKQAASPEAVPAAPAVTATETSTETQTESESPDEVTTAEAPAQEAGEEPAADEAAEEE